MEAGTTVIHNFTPPFASGILRRRFRNFPAKYPLFSGAPLTCISSGALRFLTLSASHGPSQADYGGDKNGIILTSSTVLTLAKRLLDIAYGNLLPLGLKMQDGDLDAVFEAWPAAFYGLAFILLLSPLFSKLILKLQLAPQEFVIGTYANEHKLQKQSLAIFSCMPTALNGGVALTQVPLWITKFFADGFGVAIPTWKLFQNLLLILIVPLILGKVIRNSFPGLATFVDQNEWFFSITTSILLGFFPWMQVSKSRALLMMVKPEVFVGAVGMGILVHMFFLAFNANMVRILSADCSPWKAVFEKKENRRGVMLVCSLRSLLIATAIVEQIGGVLGESGLLVLPSVAADVNQIIIDSLLVKYWLRKDESRANIKRP
ncbi:hypothetical protein Cgig2_028688 [Carnegiea gigantea]|uniref:Uncharacterized protein n=1 Tax=Carnegiea gigantea TaxID=171969 RepID=A0A9Q1KCU2_9CARY|nr:hypothetical protein Cgig2_028688 [Carnegiea gigantea]